MTESSEVPDPHDREVDAFVEQIHGIGVLRFIGRINSGLIDAGTGYEAVEKFTARQRRRPWLSRLTHLLIGRTDPMAADSRSWSS